MPKTLADIQDASEDNDCGYENLIEANQPWV